MYKNILVPLAPDHDLVGTRSMQAARALLAEGGRITVVTVLDAIPAYVANYLPEGQEERNRQQIWADLAAEFADEPDVAVEVLVGNAAQTILSVIDKAGHDCVIIASHRPGLQDYFLGSTAARVVRHAKASVLVLR